MNGFEIYSETSFSEADDLMISNFKLMDKKGLFWLSIGILVFILIGPFLPGRSRHMLMEDYSYLESILWISIIVSVLVVLYAGYYYNSFYKDYRNGKKIVVKTMILKIVRKNSKVSLVLSCPELKSKPITIDYRLSYLGISVDDYVLISFLPKSKLVLELRKIEKLQPIIE